MNRRRLEWRPTALTLVRAHLPLVMAALVVIVRRYGATFSPGGVGRFTAGGPRSVKKTRVALRVRGVSAFREGRPDGTMQSTARFETKLNRHGIWHYRESCESSHPGSGSLRLQGGDVLELR